MLEQGCNQGDSSPSPNLIKAKHYKVLTIFLKTDYLQSNWIEQEHLRGLIILSCSL